MLASCVWLASYHKFFLEEIVLSLLCVPGLFDKALLTTRVCVCFWEPYLAPCLCSNFLSGILILWLLLPWSIFWSQVILWLQLYSVCSRLLMLFRKNSHTSMQNSGSIFFFICRRCCWNFCRECIQTVDQLWQYGCFTLPTQRGRHLLPTCVPLSLFYRYLKAFSVQIFPFHG